MLMKVLCNCHFERIGIGDFLILKNKEMRKRKWGARAD
jgi:hypothetical protein